MKSSFYVLGSSSGLPVSDKATSGYLLETGESLTLFDCGGSVTQSFLKRGFDPLHVDKIFISHTHSDHVCELTLFLQLIYLHKRTKNLEIFMPEEFIVPFKSYLQAVYLLEEKLPFKLIFHPISKTADFEFDNVKIKAIQNDHLQGYAEIINTNNLPLKMQSFSFLIETNNKSILYSSDLGSIEPIKDFLSDLNFLLIETTHIQIGDLASIKGVETIDQIIATHLGTKEETSNFIQNAKQNGLQNMIIALDGMEIQL